MEPNALHLSKRCSSKEVTNDGASERPSSTTSRKDVVIKVEEIYLVNSSLKIAIKNLKKMEKVYDDINLIDPKKLHGINGIIKPLLHVIYYEVWFMFMDEIIHIQKDLIEYFEFAQKGEPQPRSKKELTDKIKMLTKPISIPFFISPKLTFKPPQIKLVVPPSIYCGF